MDQIIDKNNITFNELYDLYIKQQKRFDLILKHSDHQTRELLHLNEELRKMANTDPMTGAYNRRYFFSVAKKMLALTKREKQDISLFMIDIDKFKNINDTFGHDFGDIVIKKLVDVATELIRESDTLSRFGGEEFVVLCPNTDMIGAEILANKIRLAIKNILFQENITVTISVGVSQISSIEQNIDNAIKRSDLALYNAKETGRDKVVVYKDSLG